jgi:hypothetical protein
MAEAMIILGGIESGINQRSGARMTYKFQIAGPGEGKLSCGKSGSIGL